MFVRGSRTSSIQLGVGRTRPKNLSILLIDSADIREEKRNPVVCYPMLGRGREGKEKKKSLNGSQCREEMQRTIVQLHTKASSEASNVFDFANSPNGVFICVRLSSSSLLLSFFFFIAFVLLSRPPLFSCYIQCLF